MTILFLKLVVPTGIPGSVIRRHSNRRLAPMYAVVILKKFCKRRITTFQTLGSLVVVCMGFLFGMQGVQVDVCSLSSKLLSLSPAWLLPTQLQESVLELCNGGFVLRARYLYCIRKVSCNSLDVVSWIALQEILESITCLDKVFFLFRVIFMPLPELQLKVAIHSENLGYISTATDSNVWPDKFQFLPAGSPLFVLLWRCQ